MLLSDLDALMPVVAMNLEILVRNLGAHRQAEILQKQQAYLLETESWYHSVFESCPDGMLVIDEGAMILITNHRLDAMFGYRTGALAGQNFEALV